MPITRNSDQGSAGLVEFYREIAAEEAQQYGSPEKTLGGGHSMLCLLACIDKLFPRTQLWGLTSLYRLIVQNADNWQADWLIRIGSGLDGTFYFEYLLPPAARPWPDATVRGEAPTLADAERYLLIAMRESQGWKGNAELEALLNHYKLTC
jgi:hypothetical protein